MNFVEFDFDVHNVWSWINLARWVITICVSILSIALAIKKRKIKFSELLNNLLSWIEEAETHTTWSGAEKRMWVLDRAFKYCTTNHIAYHEEKIADELERVIALSKSVNNEYHEPVKRLNPELTGANKKQGEEENA